MQTEGMFWRNTVKPQFDKLGLFYKRIESPLTPGFVDTVVLYKGETTLIELKSKDGLETRFGVNPLQKIFLEKWNELGGKAYILTRLGQNIHLLRADNIPPHPGLEELQGHTLLSAQSRAFQWDKLLPYFARYG